MKLSDSIVAAYEKGFSGVYIRCKEDKTDEIVEKFTEFFKKIGVYIRLMKKSAYM